MSDIWLSPKEVTELEKVTERAFYKRFRQNKYKAFRYVESEKGGGKNGRRLEIALSCLNALVKSKYYSKL